MLPLPGSPKAHPCHTEPSVLSFLAHCGCHPAEPFLLLNFLARCSCHPAEPSLLLNSLLNFLFLFLFLHCSCHPCQSPATIKLHSGCISVRGAVHVACGRNTSRTTHSGLQKEGQCLGVHCALPCFVPWKLVQVISELSQDLA